MHGDFGHASSVAGRGADSPDVEPEDIRGFSPAVAARYWGLGTREYQRRADLWKLDPAGSLIPVFIIENKMGVENVRDIAAGREFGLPVGVNGTDRVQELVPSGVRMFVAIGAGSRPPPEEVPRAVGR